MPASRFTPSTTIAGLVWIKRVSGSDVDLPHAAIPGGPPSMTAHQDALTRVAVSVRDRTDAFPALRRLLRNDRPVISGLAPGDDVQTTDMEELRARARGLDESTLVIQGPPGTGKTYTGARLITDLVRAGQRVGVTAFSHKAIDNLCREIETAAIEEKLTFAGTRHAKGHHEGALITPGEGNHYPGSAVIAATSWLFVREDWDGELDYLVIDEAGQFSLADAIACGTSARNLILLGDPSQLSQVVQGSHPPGSDASALGHALGDEHTIPADRGIFLDTSLPHAPGHLLLHLQRVLRRAPALAPLLRPALDERRHRPQAPHRRARREHVVVDGGSDGDRARDRRPPARDHRRAWRLRRAPSSPPTSRS